ncbi:DUF6168 family protein [Polaribacter sp. HL-MS24]|uniref:DUF6168 family protein n=1 Tax=Polaribacter sp. HL-MS24 TaxID=3077735 RepID=UPI00293480F5|nr:DUF6168 family protein [Polaribacter sp. HL-MS24]WOC41138.1 DUF6168 family protein [Polaribacter sp. HL-MS24]
MSSKIIFQLFAFFILYLFAVNLHLFVNEKLGIELPFNLQKVYLFHATFSSLLCFNFGMLSTVDKVYHQLGFIYIAGIILKITLFSIVFYESILTRDYLSNQEAFSLLIPLFVFLLTEVVFVLKIIKKNKANTIIHKNGL